MEQILSAAAVLGTLAAISAGLLFAISKVFAVDEDERVAKVKDLLPGANCGGCGLPGCAAMAERIVEKAESGSIEGAACPAVDNAAMASIAELLGVDPVETANMTAVLRCNGTCDLRPRTIRYDGLGRCAAMHQAGSGDTLCGYGCLGQGDCAAACRFGAIGIDGDTGLPVVDYGKCTGCGACTAKCPRGLLELRKKNSAGITIVVRCSNHDKGQVASKTCKAACIGCGKCQKACAYGAVTVEKSMAYIDYSKCTECRKCEEACPTKAITAIGYAPLGTEKTEGNNKV